MNFSDALAIYLTLGGMLAVLLLWSIFFVYFRRFVDIIGGWEELMILLLGG